MVEHPQLAELVKSATHLYSSSMVALNDQSAEYTVSTIKHFFDNFIIIQYAITNTLEDHILSKIKLSISSIETTYGLTVKGVASLQANDSIKYSERKFVYAVISKANCEHPFPLCKLSQKLVFTITEIDVDSKEELGSWEDDYALDDVNIFVKDYIKPYLLPTGQFKDLWETIG